MVNTSFCRSSSELLALGNLPKRWRKPCGFDSRLRHRTLMSERRRKIEFVAEKKVSKPVKVEFFTKDGEKVSFKGHQDVKKPVKIEFYAKRNKKS